MPYLTIVSGPSAGARFDLDQETTIGRAPASGVKLDDPSVSGHHCTVRASEGNYTIKDQGSTNGTQVNGQDIKERVLRNGDRLSVGSVELEFKDENAPKPSSSDQATAENAAQPQDAGPPAHSESAFHTRKNSKLAWIVVITVLSLAALAALSYFLMALFSA